MAQKTKNSKSESNESYWTYILHRGPEVPSHNRSVTGSTTRSVRSHPLPLTYIFLRTGYEFSWFSIVKIDCLIPADFTWNQMKKKWSSWFQRKNEKKNILGHISSKSISTWLALKKKAERTSMSSMSYCHSVVCSWFLRYTRECKNKQKAAQLKFS